MFPWQHILERVLIRNSVIQLSNDVTVTLFLNQSLQTAEVFLEMITGTSVQNFSRNKCFILPWQHILLRVLRQNWVIEIIDDVTLQSISIKFCIFVCNTKKHPCTKFEQNRTRNKEVAKMRNDVTVTSFLKIAQQFLCG